MEDKYNSEFRLKIYNNNSSDLSKLNDNKSYNTENFEGEKVVKLGQKILNTNNSEKSDPYDQIDTQFICKPKIKINKKVSRSISIFNSNQDQ